MKNRTLRVRFAPSPTGMLHLGNARTALFNYLLARHKGGVLVLRIEDTDRERSSRESEREILDDLRWLGITWDEGPDVGGPAMPYRQSEAQALYQEALAELRARGAVYPCFCTREQLDADRAAQAARKEPPRYVGRCRSLDPEEAERRIAAGEHHVWRLRFPPDETEIRFVDLVRGEVVFRAGNLGGDMILVRSDGSPTYHFAVVVDDHRMGITHVLRGEDHLTNTAKQLLLFQAFGWAPPRYGHMAMILGPDRAKLSKRHGATTVRQYRNEGILSAALFNYLSLLGWSPGDDTEVMAPDEIVARFSLERLVKSAAIFDPKKLYWLNGMHLRRLPVERFVAEAQAWLEAHAPEVIERVGRERLAAVLPIYQDAIERFSELPERLAVLWDPEPLDRKDERKVLRLDPEGRVLAALEARLSAAPAEPRARAAWFVETAKAIGDELEVGGRRLYQPLRLAVTGRAHGPDLATMFAYVPDELIRERIARLRARLAQREEGA